MFKVLTFVRVVCLWFAFWWQSYALANPTSVNLLISNPRGGFGDTAASLLMTERLAQSFFNTDTKFSVVYQDGAKEQLHTLWPEFNPELDVQLVRGILFSSVEKAQVAEFGITFSSVEEVPKTVAQVSLVYHEYEELEQKGSSGLFSSMRSSRDNGPITGSGESVDFNTGFSKGVYVLDGFRPDDFDKGLTFQFLSKFARLAPISNSTKLGYAYASSPELVQQYVRAMEKFNLNKK